MPHDVIQYERWSRESEHSYFVANSSHLASAIVLETAALSEAELSEYCRRQGLFPDQMKHWRPPSAQANEWDRSQNQRLQENHQQDRQKIRELEKDVRRKDKALADIERGFRVRKQDIEIAPVYHYKPDRIRAHALICFLTPVIHRVMRMRLRQHNGAYSVEPALEKLQVIQIHQVRNGHRTYRGLTQMEPEQLDLFKIVEVKKPGIGAL